MDNILIADSGGTKTTWSFISNNKTKSITTDGIAPYLITEDALDNIITNVSKKLHSITQPSQIYYYGTGCGNIDNVKKITNALKKQFKKARIKVDTDLTAVASSLCRKEKGIACILGTGSNAGFYNGKTITKNSPGIGYILGDEGSGAYLGKMVLQHYLYKTFDEDLLFQFEQTYKVTSKEIFDHTYRMPMPNKYLASYSQFLSDNKGHYMIDNIILDGLNDFFYKHLLKFGEAWKYPVHFSGGIAFAFKDAIIELCDNYGFTLGKVVDNPMKGLIQFHQNK